MRMLFILNDAHHGTERVDGGLRQRDTVDKLAAESVAADKVRVF